MPGITGMGTTFELPNYVGELFKVSPDDTPFLSAIGGLTGGQPANATHFTWQEYDLRDADHERQRREGADAPDAEARVRESVMNVVEIHQEAVSTSYTKMAATSQYASLGANHPNVAGVGGSNPVQDEHGWQISRSLSQMSRDIEASFIQGQYNDPAADSGSEGPRRTRGLLDAITTNTHDADGNQLTEDMILDLMQEVWESGGISESETATIIAGARQRRNLTRIFITDKRFQEQTRDVGGVSLQTIETDFGRLNIMLNRYMPSDKLAVVSLEQCAPRFLPIPGKGFLFQESLARSGAAERTQLYGEVGLQYGNQRAHGKITGLSTSSGGNGGSGSTQVFITGTDSSLPVTVTDQPVEVEVVNGTDSAGAETADAETAGKATTAKATSKTTKK